METTTETQEFTVSELAKHLAVPRHRLVYALQAYSIEPARKVGAAKLFARVQVDTIKNALRRTGAIV